MIFQLNKPHGKIHSCEDFQLHEFCKGPISPFVHAKGSHL